MAGSKIGQKPPAQVNQTKKPTAPKTTQAANSKGPQLDPAIIAQLAQLQQAKNTPLAPATPPQPPAPPQGNGDNVTVSKEDLKRVLAAAKQQGGTQASPLPQQNPRAGMTPPGGGQTMSA